MQPTDNRPLLPWIFPLLAVIGVALMLAFGAESTPLAALDLSVGRAAAGGLAAAAVREQGGETAGLWSSTSYAFEADAQSYLRDALGAAELERLAAGDLALGGWRVRFFRPLNPEQWMATISSRSGRLLGFDHAIPAELPGASLPITDAQRLALRAVPAPAGELTLISRASTTQPARADHAFTWERPALSRAEGRYRYDVRVQGDQIGALREYYFLPESWRREGDWQWRRGVLLSQIGWTLTYGLTALIGLTWLLEARRGRLRWRWPVTLFLAALATGLLVALNSIPLELATYDVNQSLGSFIFERGQNYLSQLATITATIVLAGAAGAALVWESSGGRQDLSAALTWRGLTSRPVVRALLVGGLTGLFQLGFVSAFYALGARWFGVWSPVTALYDDTLSTPFPALYALAIGLLPAIGEELLFRLGGISALTRWTGKPRLAIVATAIVWASLHATYEQRPFFIRVLELSLVGVLFGVLYLRYGVLAAMAAHYTYNASLYVPLFWGGPLLPLLSGVLVAGLAGLLLLPALWRKLRGGRLAGDEALATPLPPGDPGEAALPTGIMLAAPAAPGAWRAPLLAAGAGLIGLLALGWPQPPTIERPLSRGQASAISRQLGERLGFDTAGLNAAPAAVADWADIDLAYLHDELDRAAAEAALRDHGHPRAWIVRWQAWDRPDTWSADLAPGGGLLAFERALEEDAPGATLPISAAQALALAALQPPATLLADPPALADYELIDTATSQRTARADHTFTWQTRQPVAGAAHRRIAVTVQGDRVGAVRPSLYTPPAYRRERAQQTLLRQASDDGLPLLRELGALALTLVGLWGVTRRKTAVAPWAWLGLILGLLAALLALLRIAPGRWVDPPWLGLNLALALRDGLLQGGELALLAAGAATAWGWSYPQAPTLAQQLGSLGRPGRWRRDGLLLGLALAPAGLLFMAARWWPAPAPGLFTTGTGFVSALPALDVLGRALLAATRATLLAAGLAALLQRLLGGRRLPALALVSLGLLASAAELDQPAQLAALLIAWPLATGLARLLRGNLLGLWLALLATLAAPTLRATLASPTAWAPLQIGAALACAAGLAWLLRANRQTPVQ